MHTQNKVQRVVVWDCNHNSLSDSSYEDTLSQQFSNLGYEVLNRSLVDTGGLSLSANKGDLHVISGGEAFVSGRDDWLDKALVIVGWLVERAENDDIQLLGVGLGAQLLAEYKSPGCIIYSGKTTAGIEKIEWISGFKNTYPVIYNEEIDGNLFDPELEIIKAWKKEDTGYLTVYAFADKEKNVYGTLFHPEFSIQEFKTLLKGNCEDISDNNGDFASIIKQIDGVLKSTVYSQPEVFKDVMTKLGVDL